MSDESRQRQGACDECMALVGERVVASAKRWR